VTLYLLPRDKFFKAALVFGKKTTEEILKSDISAGIKSTFNNTKACAEERRIRIDVRDNALTNDIKKLIAIKITV